MLPTIADLEKTMEATVGPEPIRARLNLKYLSRVQQMCHRLLISSMGSASMSEQDRISLKTTLLPWIGKMTLNLRLTIQKDEAWYERAMLRRIVEDVRKGCDTNDGEVPRLISVLRAALKFKKLRYDLPKRVSPYKCELAKLAGLPSARSQNAGKALLPLEPILKVSKETYPACAEQLFRLAVYLASEGLLDPLDPDGEGLAEGVLSIQDWRRTKRWLKDEQARAARTLDLQYKEVQSGSR